MAGGFLAQQIAKLTDLESQEAATITTIKKLDDDKEKATARRAQAKADCDRKEAKIESYLEKQLGDLESQIVEVRNRAEEEKRAASAVYRADLEKVEKEQETICAAREKAVARQQKLGLQISVAFVRAAEGSQRHYAETPDAINTTATLSLANSKSNGVAASSVSPNPNVTPTTDSIAAAESNGPTASSGSPLDLDISTSSDMTMSDESLTLVDATVMDKTAINDAGSQAQADRMLEAKLIISFVTKSLRRICQIEPGHCPSAVYDDGDEGKSFWISCGVCHANDFKGPRGFYAHLTKSSCMPLDTTYEDIISRHCNKITISPKDVDLIKAGKEPSWKPALVRIVRPPRVKKDPAYRVATSTMPTHIRGFFAQFSNSTNSLSDALPRNSCGESQGLAPIVVSQPLHTQSTVSKPIKESLFRDPGSKASHTVDDSVLPDLTHSIQTSRNEAEISGTHTEKRGRKRVASEPPSSPLSRSPAVFHHDPDSIHAAPKKLRPARNFHSKLYQLLGSDNEDIDPSFHTPQQPS